jgi:hypothetical protein
MYGGKGQSVTSISQTFLLVKELAPFQNSNMIMSPMGPETKIDCSGETQEQFTQPTNQPTNHGSLNLKGNK